jgi:hypothetical protein
VETLLLKRVPHAKGHDGLLVGGRCGQGEHFRLHASACVQIDSIQVDVGAFRKQIVRAGNELIPSLVGKCRTRIARSQRKRVIDRKLHAALSRSQRRTCAMLTKIDLREERMKECRPQLITCANARASNLVERLKARQQALRLKWTQKMRQAFKLSS